jgi:hypothetical protein
MYAPIWRACSLVSSGSLRSFCASCRAAGIRPVLTWNSTAAEPTPMRLGPWSGTPCALRPWQVMHVVSNNCLPFWASSLSAGWSSAAAGTRGTKAV